MKKHLWLPPLVTIALTLAPAPFLTNRYYIFPLPIIIGAAIVGVLLFLPLIVPRSERVARGSLGGFCALLIALDAFAFLSLFRIILSAGSTLRGESLLLSAADCWLINVAAFALVYWFLGEIVTTSPESPALLFPESDGTAIAHTIIDYIFVAATAALAFGPTDTPPANTLARVAMLTEALVSFVIVALVAARAVNAIA